MDYRWYSSFVLGLMILIPFEFCLFWCLNLTVSHSHSLKVSVIQCVFFLLLDKAPRLSISNDFWILSSDTICQLNQIFSNSEAAMLSTTNYLGCKSSQRNILLLIICFLLFCHLFRHCLCFSLFHEMNELTVENWIISRFPLWSTSWHSWCKNTFIEIPELLILWSFTTK